MIRRFRIGERSITLATLEALAAVLGLRVVGSGRRRPPGEPPKPEPAANPPSPPALASKATTVDDPTTRAERASWGLWWPPGIPAFPAVFPLHPLPCRPVAN